MRTIAMLCLLAMSEGNAPLVDTPGDPIPAGVRAEVRWLESTLDDTDATKMNAVFPEGELFSFEFYGLALLDIAEQSGRADDRERAAKAVRAMLPKIDAMLSHQPFRPMRGWSLRGGVCWFGGQNLLRAKLVSLLGSEATAAETQRLHADTSILAAAFAKSQSGVLEAHPGLTWPVDSLFALESLQVHDAQFGTHDFDPAWKKHRATLVATIGNSGLPASFVHLDGSARDVPRGCALSWTLSVLPRLDPALSRSIWASYKRGFFSCDSTPCLVREYPVGTTRKQDIDSGPIIDGYGMAATGFALAAARANGDGEIASRLEKTGELFGAPSTGAFGKHYLGGSVPMFDVLALYVRTVPTPTPRAGAMRSPTP